MNDKLLDLLSEMDGVKAKMENTSDPETLDQLERELEDLTNEHFRAKMFETGDEV